jgi:uncharacterized protein
MSKSQTYIFQIQGMHCRSCEIFLENRIIQSDEVLTAKANLSKQEILITTQTNKDPQTLAKNLTQLVSDKGYSLHLEKIQKIQNLEEIFMSLGLALIIGLAFLSLQKFGIINLINSEKITYPLAFGIGMVASLSSCMIVVGGLLLGLSATWSKENIVKHKDLNKYPHVFFHISRLLTFVILGGFLGSVGSVFKLSSTSSIILNVFIAILMLGLGLNLLDIFDFAKKLHFSLPSIFTKKIFEKQKITNLTPILMGMATFFLPCGFTQTMQVYSLSTGSFTQASLTMFSFAMGTLPMLIIISFCAFNFSKSSFSGIFFKTTGFLVIAFALFNIYSNLIALGLIPFFTF